MKNLMKFAALGAALAVSALSAHATAINGSLAISGADSFSSAASTTFTGPFTVSTGVGGVTGTFLTGIDGSFAGKTVTMPASITWTGSSANGVQLFLTPSSGTPNASFTISSVTFDSIVAGFQLITGTGTFNESGYDPTVGTFTLSSSTTGGSTELELTAGASPTPEPSSLMLLGTGLTGAAGMLFRRRRSIA